MKLQWPLQSIRGQFLSAFLLCIAIPITVIFYLYYTSSEKLLIQEVNRSYTQLLENEALAMNDTAEQMLYVANLLSNDTEVLQFLKADTSWLTEYAAFQKYKAVDSRLNNTATFMLDGSAVIHLIDTRGYLFSSWKLNDVGQTHDKLMDSGWLKEPLVKQGYPMWRIVKAADLDLVGMDPDEDILVLVKEMRELLQRSYGVVIIGYPLRMQQSNGIHSIGAKLDDDKLLIDDGQLLAGDAQLYAQLFGPEKTAAVKDYLVNSRLIDSIGWQLVHVTPKKQFTGQLEQLRNQSIIWLFALFLLLIVLFVYLVLRIIRPIKQLVRAMTKVGMGDFPTIKVEGAYEMRQLHAHFLKMVANLQELIRNLSEEQRRKEEARFQALQSQIKPHFLFNTLNSIKWSARLSGAENVSQMINSLGKLLTASMRHDQEIIPLREELEFVRYYVELQNVRFNNSIKLELDVSERLQLASINKLLLQPLVENSILHGGQFPQPLTVNISAYDAGGLLTITVSDDGKGLPDHVDYDEPARAAGVEQQGIGLDNIRERIHLYFGPQYGLTIASSETGGAVVQIVIPLQEKGEMSDV